MSKNASCELQDYAFLNMPSCEVAGESHSCIHKYLSSASSAPGTALYTGDSDIL